MLSGLIVCVLLSVGVAAKPGVPFSAAHGAGVKKVSREEHEPCCAPRYFTLKQESFVTSAEGGSLKVEHLSIDVGYDSVSQQVSLKVIEDFYNGTDRYFKLIEDYTEEVSYLIIRHGDDEACFVDKTEGRFPEECLPEDAAFLGESTLGDYDLVLDNWYFAKDEGTKHIIKSVQHEGCVPVGLLVRTFDKETGKEISISDDRALDFSLGICDRDEYFKPPATCEEGRALAEPTQKMLTMRGKVRLI